MKNVGDEITYYWNYPENTTGIVAGVETAHIYTVTESDGTQRRIYEIDGKLWKAPLTNVDPV